MTKLIYTNKYPMPPSRLVSIKPKRSLASILTYPIVYSASKEYVKQKDIFCFSPFSGLCLVISERNKNKLNNN
jgi:hypothetical protein